ncbi:MAG: hypothetical protein GY941_21850 [Planctomycetes bacterium]|nr:hypothetical protein [Planctomycetota bacterium]
MSMQVWKYKIEPLSTLEMPIGAKILCVDCQRGTPTMWVLVDTDAMKVNRKFHTYGTGEAIDANSTYIGTFQMDNGFLVFHVFEHNHK